MLEMVAGIMKHNHDKRQKVRIDGHIAACCSELEEVLEDDENVMHVWKCA